MSGDESLGGVIIGAYKCVLQPDGWAVIDTRTKEPVRVCGLLLQGLQRQQASDIALHLNLIDAHADQLGMPPRTADELVELSTFLKNALTTD